MMGLRLGASVFLGVLLACVAEAGGVAVAGRASSLGLGLEVTAGLSDRLNLRLAGNTFAYSRSFIQDDSDEFNLDFDLRSLAGVVDWHPSGGGFHVSGGVVGNGNKAGLLARAAGGSSYGIGDHRYSVSDVGALTGRASVKKAAGYAGIGWGNPVAKGKRVGVVFDLGVVFQGSPEVSLGATGPIAGDAAFQQDLRLEERDIGDDARRFRYYPVVSLGISVKLH